MDFNKARERALTYFAKSEHGFLQHGIHSPFVNDKFMMTEPTLDNLLIRRSDQLVSRRVSWLLRSMQYAPIQ